MLEQTYRALREHHLTESQYDFSTQWCGMSQSYLSWLKASGAKPSYKALVLLAQRLREAARAKRAEPDPIFPEVTAHDARMLDDLQQQVVSALMQPHQ